MKHHHLPVSLFEQRQPVRETARQLPAVGVPLRLLNWEKRSWEEVAKPVLGAAEVEIERAGRFINPPEGWDAVAVEREEESFDEEFEEDMMFYQDPWQAQLTYLDLSLRGRLR